MLRNANPSAEKLIQRLEQMITAVRQRPAEVEVALNRVMGRTSESPDLVYVYPQQRRTELLKEIAASAGLSPGDLVALVGVASGIKDPDEPTSQA